MIASLVESPAIALDQAPIRGVATRANMEVNEPVQIADFLRKAGAGYLLLGVLLLGTIVLFMVLYDGSIALGVLLGALVGAIVRWQWSVQPLSMAAWVDVPLDKRPDRQVLRDIILRFRQRTVVALSVLPELIVVIVYLWISRSSPDRVLFHMRRDAIFGLFLGFICTVQLAAAAECLQVRAALSADEAFDPPTIPAPSPQYACQRVDMMPAYDNIDGDEPARIKAFLRYAALGYLALGVLCLAVVGVFMVSSHGQVTSSILVAALAAVAYRWCRPIHPVGMARVANLPPSKQPDVQQLADAIRRVRLRGAVVFSVLPLLVVVGVYLVISRSSVDRVLFHSQSDALVGLFLGYASTFNLASAAECVRVRSALNSGD